jgi:cytochrome c-type biogenesis protein CcmH
MLTFWIGAILLTALAAYPIVHLASRPRALAADPAQAVYRRQLAELDELAGRGVLVESELQAAHAEAARRLLGAAAGPPEAGPTRGSRLAVLVAVGLIGLCAPALYLVLGAPGMPDQPYARRLAAWRVADPATLQPAEMAAVLEALAAERPGDAQPLVYLARAQAASGDAASAARSLLRALKIRPDDADLWTLLGQLRVADAEDKVTPEAVDAFRRANALDAKAPTPRYYLARAMIEAGDVAGGVARWRALAAELPADQRAALEQDIAAAGRAPAATPSGPDILAMVEGLAARLAAAPDDPAGWERLVRSYRVLGDEKKLNEALAQARVQFKGRDDVLGPIEAAGAGR